VNLPWDLIYPLESFAADFRRQVEAGEQEFSDSSVAFVGLARNCAPQLQANLLRLEKLVEGCREWRLHIETNDNTDETDQVLIEFCRHYPQATFLSQRLDRKQFSAEFAGPRTVALAEYRTACQSWVRDHASNADYVVVVDWDSCGGWSHPGFLHGVGLLKQTADAIGMASVSLMEWQKHGQWLQYDVWALRLNSSFDDYTAGIGARKHSWLPPVGSPPVPVCSAFGGLCIYRAEDFLQGTYDGSDCEHVPFHASIANKTGKRLYLNPSQRTVMQWMPEVVADGPEAGGQHSPVSG
jgi:hypothetical protein